MTGVGIKNTKKCLEQSPIVPSHFIHTPENRTQNLLVANSALSVCATHLALETNETYLGIVKE